MTIQIDLWVLLSSLGTLLVMFIGAVFAGGRILLAQSRQQLDERFAAQEAARKLSAEAFQERFVAHMREEEKALARIPGLERELLELKADLPVRYVRREDYIRGQTVIEAKLDALYSELKVVQIQGATKLAQIQGEGK